MHYEPRISPTSQPTMLHRSHSTSPCWTEIESRARDLLVATTGIEQNFLWRQSPKASFSPNLPATMGKTETGDKTDAPISLPLLLCSLASKVSLTPPWYAHNLYCWTLQSHQQSVRNQLVLPTPRVSAQPQDLLWQAPGAPLWSWSLRSDCPFQVRPHRVLTPGVALGLVSQGHGEPTPGGTHMKWIKSQMPTD